MRQPQQSAPFLFWYRETNAKEQIAARIAQKRVMLMSPQTEFNSAYMKEFPTIRSGMKMNL